jgi:hypothetical protein
MLVGKYKHYCHEWDGLEIDETCPEFSGCSCFERLLKLKTNYGKRLSKKIMDM